MESADSNGLDTSLIHRLEDFCTAARFTSAIDDFISAHVDDFDFGEEQKLIYYERYQEYIQLIERMLDEFLQNEGVTQDEVFALCSKLTEADPGSVTCVDYLLAVTEYEQFHQLMLDFKNLRNWEFDADDAQSDALSWDAPEEAASDTHP
eukprot:GILJ01003104.1.p1 GENE.GILJ01003104.1~~GILJ01003104.1.p1  ORF type:complete len:166 (-),score=24.01 GILJ01003104.1:324-773(-)